MEDLWVLGSDYSGKWFNEAWNYLLLSGSVKFAGLRPQPYVHARISPVEYTAIVRLATRSTIF